MEFGKHLSKGLWGIADKALPVIYGVAYVVLVIRVLPEEEFGSLVLVQEIFLIISNLAAAFALQPLLKYASEVREDHRDTIGAAVWLNIGILAVSSILILLLKGPTASLLNTPSLEALLPWIVVMLAANFFRNFTLVLLQTRFHVKQVFWIDVAHFLGAPALILVWSWLHIFDSAYDVIIITIISLSLSSLVGIWLSWSMLRFSLKPHRDEIWKMWHYGKYSIGNILSSLLISKIDSFVLAAFTGPAHVAVYNSVKVFVRLYDMIPQVIQMFVLPAASKLSSLGEFARLKVVVEKAVSFSTVAMMPVMFLFLFLSPWMIDIVYEGRYNEAAVLLQIFSVLSFMMPVTSVASNVLMGTGEVRLNFFLNVSVFVISTALFLLLIPRLDYMGATIGYVLSALVQMWLFTRSLKKHVPITLSDVLRRTDDIWQFVVSFVRR